MPTEASIDTYTVVFDRDGNADRAIVAVLGRDDTRTLTHATDPATIDQLLHSDACGVRVAVRTEEPVPISTIA